MTRLTLTGMVIVVLTALQLVSMPQEAVATLIASENFESYTVGSSVAGGAGGTGAWSANWSSAGGTPSIVSGTLSGFGQSLELAPAAGTHSNNIAFRQFTLPSQTGPVYIGFVLQTNASFSDNDFFQLFLDNDTSGILGTAGDADNASSFVLVNGGTYGLRQGPTSAQTTVSSPTHSNGVTNRLVLKISKDSGLATDRYNRVELFLDGTSIISRANPNLMIEATMSVLHFRLSSLEAADRVYIDDLRIATTFAESVPEPSGMALVCFGLTLGIAVLRKRV